MSNKLNFSRRKFLVGSAAASGGFALGVYMPGIDRLSAQDSGGAEIGAWVFIKPDDQVVIRIARSEMGQGTLTGLAQFVAEELECDWSKVTTEYPTPGQNLARNRVWRDFFTAGSQGIRNSQEFVRKGGAAARMMLLEAAAKEWGVPVAELTVDKGVITHAKSNRSVTYGKIATAASKLEVPKDADITLKDPKTWKIAGKSLNRLDTPDKLTGKQIYSIDVTLPGMLNATIMDAPVFGAKLKSYDEAKAKAMPGVKGIYPVGETAIAVVADTFWQAKKALDALNPQWEQGLNDQVSSDTIAAFLKEGLETKEGVHVGNKVGDPAQAIAGAAKKLEAVFYSPYQHQATMEPMNATAKAFFPASRIPLQDSIISRSWSPSV